MSSHSDPLPTAMRTVSPFPRNLGGKTMGNKNILKKSLCKKSYTKSVFAKETVSLTGKACAAKA